MFLILAYAFIPNLGFITVIRCISLKKSTLALVVSVIIFSSLFVTQVSAQVIGIQEGTTISYNYIRTFAGNDTIQMGDALYHIQKFNETSLQFKVTAQSTVNCSITYQNGYPIYTNYIEALIYLPPQAIQASQQGNINWINQIDAPLMIGLQNKTVENLNLKTGTGTYNTVNITMYFTAGSLNMIYDVNSGGLIYQEFRYVQGNSISQTMNSVEFNSELLNNTAYYSLFLPIFTLIPMLAVIVLFLKNRNKTDKHAGKEPREGVPKNSLIIVVLTAFLSFVAVFIPWSQIQGSLIYLPYSLPTFFTYSLLSPAPAFTFTLTSVMAHLAAITVWVAVGFYLLSDKKMISQLTSVISVVFSFVSVGLFLQTGLSIYAGLPLVAVAAILLIINLILAAKIITVTIEPETHSNNKS